MVTNCRMGADVGHHEPSQTKRCQNVINTQTTAPTTGATSFTLREVNCNWIKGLNLRCSGFIQTLLNPTTCILSQLCCNKRLHQNLQRPRPFFLRCSAVCWSGWVKSSGRSVCGSPRVWDGLIWRTVMDGSLRRHGICGWHCQSPSCF